MSKTQRKVWRLMSLSRKTLVYSTIISVIMVSLIVGYFTLMLPSLYVSYMQDRNYDSIVELQEGYMNEGSYKNLEVKNPTGTITIEVPLSSNVIYVVNKFFRINVEVRDQDLLESLDKIRYYAQHKDEIKEINDFEDEDFNLTEIKDRILNNKEFFDSLPVKLEVELYDNDNVMEEIYSKSHIVSDDLFVYESNVTDGHNYYTSYIAMGLTDTAIAISFLPVMSPRIDEIRPVIFQSLPMIIAIALLLVLVSSQVFSKLIIIPIIKLANHAEFMKEANNLQLEPLVISGHDEISSLAGSLNGLYQKIQESYQELEIKNEYLAEENKRQEVFLRASSHQLKTPIAAALLLLQGMINEVGKYKDVKEHLPQVKQQVQTMQRIVEDILSLNSSSQNLQMEPFNLNRLMEECLNAYHVQIEEKSLQISSEGESVPITSDRELIKKILDNLISNAVYFTPIGSSIMIRYEKHRICIINEGVTIQEDLLPHVFEPFVTSVYKNKAHGLGLYVVSYYAKLLHCQVKVKNTEHSVLVELSWES